MDARPTKHRDMGVNTTILKHDNSTHLKPISRQLYHICTQNEAATVHKLSVIRANKTVTPNFINKNFINKKWEINGNFIILLSLMSTSNENEQSDDQNTTVNGLKLTKKYNATFNNMT